MAVQQKLLDHTEIKCPACVEMYKVHNYEASELDEAVSAVLDCDVDPKDRFETEKPVPTDQQAALIIPKRGRRRKTKNTKGKNEEDGLEHLDDVADENGDTGPAACMEFLKRFEGIIQLLPSGSFGKRVPYRCLICRNRTQPFGRVGELSKMRYGYVKHFVNQHCKGDKHRCNLRILRGEDVIKQPMAKCEALCVGDPEVAGRLYQHQDIFSLWASMCNFQDHARHKYRRDANNESWIIRSASCEEECEAPKSGSRPVCKACLALGGPHGVTWWQVASQDCKTIDFMSLIKFC